MLSHKTFHVGTIVVVLAAALAGCAPASSDSWVVPTLPTSVPRFTADESLPFDSYSLTDLELERMQTEEAALLTECAQRHGLEAAFGGDYIRPDDVSYVSWGGRPGTMPLEHAAEFGYHPGPTGPWAHVGGFYLKDPANVQAAGSSDPDSLMILFGMDPENPDAEVPDSVPEGGCYGEVEATLGGPITSVTFTNSDLINLALKHPDVKAASEAWRSCMKAGGFQFDTVYQASESFTMATLSAHEIDVAIADVTCTESSQWADIFYYVLADYQTQAIKHDPATFEQALSSQQERLRALDALQGDSE